MCSDSREGGSDDCLFSLVLKSIYERQLWTHCVNGGKENSNLHSICQNTFQLSRIDNGNDSRKVRP